MKILARDCKGLFARGTPDECPPNFAIRLENFYLKGPNLIPRPGFTPITAGLTPKTFASHISIYEPVPVAGVVSSKTIVHKAHLGTLQIYNNTDFPGAPIFSPTTANYHSWVNFFGRGYFTLHNTIVGDPLDKVQVYLGGTTTRNAMGAKPISSMAGVAGAGGLLGVGSYLVDVCYVTDSGFITKPSGSVLKKDCFGSYKIDLTVIPVGPAGTVARQIILTKAIDIGTYTGNPNDYEFFFLPNGLINDNVTTTFTVSEYDGNLISSADYLLDQLESVASGVGIGDYNSRMLIWGENANPSIIRISKPGDPESISATSGFIIVDPTESGGVTNCIVLRKNLYIFKSNRIFVTSDNGDDPSTWSVDIFDAGVGTECYGTSKIFDSKGTHLNQFLIGSRSGLFIFDGIIRYPELTYNVQDIWDDIDKSLFGLVQIAIDSINKHIYCLIPRTGGNNQILLGDYSDGMDKDNIKWSIWTITTRDLACIAIQFDSTSHILVTIGTAAALVTFDPANPVGLDSGASFNCIYQSPVIATDPTQDLQQITVAKLRQINGGPTDITVRAVSAADNAKFSPTYTMPFLAVNKIQDKWVYLPFVDYQPTVEFTVVSTNKPKLSNMGVVCDVYGESDPR